MYWFQERMVFVPSKGAGADPSVIGLAFEDVEVTTDDGERLHGWFVPTQSAPAPTVMFFHGNAGNISHRLDTIALHHTLGHNVFIIDYRGYGTSSGRASEEGLHLDAIAAWNYLTRTRAIKAGDIVLHGRSLGAAVANRLGLQTRPGAVISESAFTSIPDVAAELYPFLPVRLLARIHFPNADRIGGLSAPVLIAHSTDDQLIPYSHAERLMNAARDGTQMLTMRGGHGGGFMQSGSIYTSGIGGFIRDTVASSALVRE
jgi:uncharacterized protein